MAIINGHLYKAKISNFDPVSSLDWLSWDSNSVLDSTFKGKLSPNFFGASNGP